ncbi:MAG: SH3 domain-containing protein [Spirosomataceae bacterium]
MGVIYFIALLILLNLPSFYKIAIINNDPVHLRESPSSAATVKWSIAKGNKVTIIDEHDQWFRIWWQQRDPMSEN